MDDLMTAWENFSIDDLDNEPDKPNNRVDATTLRIAPKCNALYISTKTKICYLNKPIDLKTVFWQIPVIPYQ